jgi:hypothetical protein
MINIKFTKLDFTKLTWSTNSDREPKSEAGRMLVEHLIIGPPMPTENRTVAQLEREDIIGLYLPSDAPVKLVDKAGRFFLG